jgi:hypothetical protein
VGRVTNTITTINNTIRTVLATAIVGLLGAGGYVAYDKVTADQQRWETAQREMGHLQEELTGARSQIEQQQGQIAGLREDVAERDAQIERMQTAMRLLKMDQRLARLEVIDQQPIDAEEGDEEPAAVLTTVRFSELTPDGDPIGTPREFTVRGDIVYVDNWVVKFDDHYVEEADLARGTSLALFRRIFGEHQNPADGFPLDEVGSMPQAYPRGDQPSEFEQEIWSDFWEFANNRERAEAKGIRAAHGEAISIRTQPGRSYRIVLRASDGLAIVPE